MRIISAVGFVVVSYRLQRLVNFWPSLAEGSCFEGPLMCGQRSDSVPEAWLRPVQCVRHVRCDRGSYGAAASKRPMCTFRVRGAV